jgi:osmotically-inducible protein OsmY
MMADNNRNWRDQYNQRNDDDWQQSSSNRSRRDDYNQSYQNSNNNDQRGQRGSWESSGFDDMDDNSSRRSNVGDSHDRYSNMGNSPYESRNRGQQQNQGGYQHSNWGNPQRRGNDWNRPEDQWGSAGMYGGDFGREDNNRNDWRNKMSNSGNRYGNSNWQDSNYGGYSPGYNEQNQYSSGREPRNRYGGDTSNYGNANQGGFDRNWWDRTKDKVSSWFNDDDDDRNRNRQYSGGHRGKGPKDYQRSSDRIKEDVCDRLSDDDALDATHIQVQVQGNEVVLSGTVADRYQKRYAEDLVESISGVRHVENRIRVGTSNDLTSHEYTGNTSNVGGIGNESGTTNEIIRNTGNTKKGNI